MNNQAHIYTYDDVQKIKPQLDALSLVDESTSTKARTLVFGREGNILKVLTTNDFPGLFHQVEDRLLMQDFELEIYYTDTTSFWTALAWFWLLKDKQAKVKADDLEKMNSRGDIAVTLIKKMIQEQDKYTEEEFINQLLALSYQAGASDVHFQSEEVWVVMRLRRDGVLETITIFTHASWRKYTMKMKFISGAKMNLDDTSQDGRFDIEVQQPDENIKIDVRTSILPGLRWESIVLRFLDARKGLMTFEDIWFGSYHTKLLEEQLAKHSGLILVTGPTGSWKTTTVYSLINYLNSPERKVITLEDPVEYELPGIEQSQINAEKWYTFEEWLKGVLRHDPDIIMVWEIRSLETAEMAINAALTWHLVISTLHTNSSIDSIARLVNMWVKPYMLWSALNAIIGQRLIRKLATQETYTPSATDEKYLNSMIKEIKAHTKGIKAEYTGTLVRPKGGERSRSKGYKGRVAVLEALDVNETITKAIMQKKDSYEILEIAKKEWYLTLEHNAVLKVLEWVTSLAEIRRQLGE